jgi:V8-like Glu-specific endopeptidase
MYPLRSYALSIAVFAWFASSGNALSPAAIPSPTAIEISRASTVEVSSGNGTSKGTGFLISDQHVATAFHVAAAVSALNSEQVKFTPYPDLKVKMPDGEVLDATLVSVPTQKDLAPLKYDFAVLRLRRKPQGPYRIVQLIGPAGKIAVDEEVTFSGYPLAAPGMITHRGRISGFSDAEGLIPLDGAVNRGNSGGAVLSASREVVGIITMREGAISQALDKVRGAQIETKLDGSGRTAEKPAEMNDGSSAEATRQITDALTTIIATQGELIGSFDTYMSTGIGYARDIKFLRDYLHTHPYVLK